MQLILRTTNAQAEIDGLTRRDWGKDDYTIADGDQVVGRIYPEAIHGDPKWLWFLQTVPATPPNQGIADTLKEAMAAFKARYADYVARTRPPLE